MKTILILVVDDRETVSLQLYVDVIGTDLIVPVTKWCTVKC